MSLLVLLGVLFIACGAAGLVVLGLVVALDYALTGRAGEPESFDGAGRIALARSSLGLLGTGAALLATFALTAAARIVL